MINEHRGLALAGAVIAALGNAAPALADHGPAPGAGAGYAGYLQSLGNLGYRYNRLLGSATDCEVPVLAGSSLECRIAPMHVWGQVEHGTLSRDGDVQPGDYSADRWSLLAGFDKSVSPAAVVGASIGKASNEVRLDGVGNRVRGDGLQAGLYATFDPGQFYIKLLGAYTAMDGDARRSSGAGTVEADPDVRLWSLGLHGGYRIQTGATSVITPYLNYDWTSAKLKAFDESAGGLSASAGRQTHGWVTAGVKLAGEVAGVVPEANIGYRHRFGSSRASLNAAFTGHPDFDILSTRQAPGALLAGIGIGGKLGAVNLRVAYEGAFNGDMKEHSGALKLVVPLGSVGVPPPPPPPELDLDSPTATDMKSCPDGSAIPASEACAGPSSPALVSPSERG